jgi:hypothetical protein
MPSEPPASRSDSSPNSTRADWRGRRSAGVTSSTSDPSGFRSTATSPTTRWAAYLAKYATKATEVAGHVSSRLNAATIGAYATGRTHPNLASRWRAGYGRFGCGRTCSDSAATSAPDPAPIPPPSGSSATRAGNGDADPGTAARTSRPRKRSRSSHLSQLRRHRLAHQRQCRRRQRCHRPMAPERRRTARDETQHIADLMAH